MLKILRKLFSLLSSFDKFLKLNQVKEFNGFVLVLLGIFGLAALGMFLQDKFNNEIVFRFAVFVFGAFWYLLIPYGFFRFEGLRKYIFWGKRQTYGEIFRQFGLKSYAVFLLFFSYTTMFPVIGIPALLNMYKIHFIYRYVFAHFSTLIVFNVLLASVFWFAYHVIYLSVTLQEIKTKVALYTAIGTSITVFINNLGAFKNLYSIVAYLLLSYLWVRYLIELKALELESDLHGE